MKMANNVFGKQKTRKLNQIIETISFYYLASLFLIEPAIGILFPHLAFNIPYVYSLTGLLIVIPFLFIRFYQCRRLSLSWIDIGWFALLLYNLPEYIKHNCLPTSFAIVAAYILSRLLAHREKMEYIFIIGGLAQILLMLLQKYAIIPSLNSYFPVTGSFKNPGPLGGYLAICLIVCISHFATTKKLERQGIRVFSSFLFVCALIYSDSRAAWLSTAVALLYIGMNIRRIHIKKQLLAYLMLVAICGSISLTLYKTASAQGRIAVWKISCPMLQSNPITGNGHNSFRRDYMEYQAHYIQKHPDDPSNLLLSNNGYAFNEYIRIQYERGSIGLLLVSGIFVLHCFADRKRQILPALIVLAVFSFFSYPSDVLLLLLQAAILSGSLPHSVSFCISNKKVTRWSLTAMSALMFLTIGKQYAQHRKLEKNLTDYICYNHRHSLDYLRQHVTAFEHSLDFSSRYARTLYLKEAYEEAAIAIRQTISLYPTTDKYLDLGDTYRQLEKYQDAEAAYRHAIHLLPNLIYPYYSLYLLYKHIGREQDATEISRQMRHLQPKKKNARHQEIMHFLNENEQKSNTDSTTYEIEK